MRQDLLEPSARKTTMQLVFQKRHPAVKRWKKQKGRSDRAVERHGRERTCRCARRSILVSLCKNLPAGFCRLVFIDCGGGNGKPFLRTVPLLFSSHLVRGDCTGQDVVDCGAWLTRTPRRRIVYLFNDPSFLLFLFFCCGCSFSNVRW